ncbi:ATP-binding protein [Streptomyces sp. NPDC051567]|uniref:ATP-binding protein n=1 Tax=Streptomyces sp. NPDC051567 TaxID=3365660 RepID=UPI0037874500
MSLPLTRRIARAALLLAAGTAPVVGAAGVASAAGLESVPQLGTLTAPITAPDTAGDPTAALTDTAARTLPAAGPAADLTGTASGLLGKGGLPTDTLTGSQSSPLGSLGGLPLGR